VPNRRGVAQVLHYRARRGCLLANEAMLGVSLGGTFLPEGPAIRQRGPCTAAKRKDVDFERWGSREIRLPVVRMTGASANDVAGLECQYTRLCRRASARFPGITKAGGRPSVQPALIWQAGGPGSPECGTKEMVKTIQNLRAGLQAP